jgi:hypothetical protein
MREPAASAAGFVFLEGQGQWAVLIVIPSKRFLRSEGSGRAARCVAFFATQ